MTRTRTLLTLAIVLMLGTGALMTGCGGGDTPDPNATPTPTPTPSPSPSPTPAPGGNITRTLLFGVESGNPTRSWRVISIKGNANYNATGGDQPCPVVLTAKDDSEVYACDRRVLSDGRQTAIPVAFVENYWVTNPNITIEINGSDLKLTQPGSSSLTPQVWHFTVTTEPSVNGKLRIRVKQTSYKNELGFDDPFDNGFEVLQEEV